MGRDTLTPKEMSDFLRQKCGVKVRDWQTDDDWKAENIIFNYIIAKLKEYVPGG